MPTYVYETTSRPTRRYEFKQSMKDAPLRAHPETGEEICRVITGGLGYLGKSRGDATPAPASQGCGAGCGCHH